MATFWAETGNKTPGTGAGTKADPWPLNDMFVGNTNPKGLATTDVAVIKKKGVENMTTFISPIPSLVFGADANGDIPDELVSIPMDFTGAGSVLAAVAFAGGFGRKLIGFDIRNVTGRGVSFTDGVSALGFKVTDVTGHSYYIPNGIDNIELRFCCSLRAGANGFHVLETGDTITLLGCVDEDSVLGSTFKAAMVDECIFIMDNAAPGTAAFTANSTSNQGTSGQNNTVYMRGAGTGWVGFRIQNDPNNTSHLIDSFVQGNGASGSVGWDLNSKRAYFQGNYYNNLETVVANPGVAPMYAAPVEVPGFTFKDGAAGDLTPEIQMMATTQIRRILNEGLDHRTAGVLDFVASGGGGGSKYRPRLIGG